MTWTSAAFALAVLAVSAGGAAAQDHARPFNVKNFPIEVRKTLSLGPVTCREVEGSSKAGFAPDTVRKVDFNGDGRLDYVVSFENTTCGRERSGGFCGTGGCMVDFLVTLPNGSLRSVFAGQVHSCEILSGRPRKVRFWIHHSYCPDRTDGCSRDVRIGRRIFTPMR